MGTQPGFSPFRRLSERGLTERVQSSDDGRATDAVLTKKGMNAMVEAAPGHAMLVKKLFFEPLPDELVAPFTAALEHIQASLNLELIAATRAPLSAPRDPW